MKDPRGKIVEYKIICSKVYTEHSEEINNLLDSEEHWYFKGDLRIFNIPSYWVYFQEMLRFEPWEEEDGN